MLVFTRKRQEAIVIGDGIEIRVLRIGREGVRIGVSAPPSVRYIAAKSTIRSAQRTSRPRHFLWRLATSPIRCAASCGARPTRIRTLDDLPRLAG